VHTLSEHACPSIDPNVYSSCNRPRDHFLYAATSTARATTRGGVEPSQRSGHASRGGGWHPSSGATPAPLSRSPLRRWRVAASPVGRRPTHRLPVPARARAAACRAFFVGALATPPPLVNLLGGVAADFAFFLDLAVAPPCGRRSRSLRCGCAAALCLCLPRVRRRGATVEAVQSAAGCTRPPRRRCWPPPTRGQQRADLLAYPSRPPEVLELIQQPEGHSALLLLFPVSLYLFLSLPAGPDFQSASSFGGTSVACFEINISRSWRLCPSTSGYRAFYWGA